MQNPSIGEEERLLRLKQVLEIIPVSKSSWLAGVCIPSSLVGPISLIA